MREDDDDSTITTAAPPQARPRELTPTEGDMMRLTNAEMELVWNPYAGAEMTDEAAEQSRRSNTLVRQLRAEGYTLRVEQLYHPDGSTAGRRVGLFDTAGCVEERFYTHEGRGDIRAAARTLVNIDGRAPTFWATEAL